MDSSGHHHRLQAPGLYRTRRVRRNGDERHLRRYSFVVACSDAQCCRLSGNGYPRLEHYAPRSVGASKRGTLCGWCDAAGPGHGAERDLRGLVGIAALRMEALPRWAAVLLVIGSLGMLGFNDQNAQVLMAIPFGIGWVAVGYALWSGWADMHQRTSRVA